MVIMSIHEMEVKDSVSEAPAELRKVELEAAVVPVELEGQFPKDCA